MIRRIVLLGARVSIKSNQAIKIEEFQEYNLAVKVPCAEIITEGKPIKVLLGTRLKGVFKWEESFVINLPGKIGTIAASAVVCYDTLKDEDLRSGICKVAEHFIGGLYTWGGRSIYDEELEKEGQLTGVDCSNLVALCYKVHGIDIPRNTRSQHKSEDCKKIELGVELKSADVVFTARERFGKYWIGHVMLYIGNDTFIESAGRDIREVVKVTGKERFGKSIKELKNGDVTDYGKVYFGSFLP